MQITRVWLARVQVPFRRANTGVAERDEVPCRERQHSEETVMNVLSTTLLMAMLVLGAPAAHAEAEGNGAAQVDRPAGNGVYAVYASNGNGELVAVTPAPTPAEPGNLVLAGVSR